MLTGVACGGKSASNGKGGAGGGAAARGGTSGSGGIAGGAAGSSGMSGSGGIAGSGGTAGSEDGGEPITSCPASPHGMVPCAGTFTCQFTAVCTCHGCCVAFWSCLNGTFAQRDFNDGCMQGPTCPDSGADASPATDGPASVCTFGADQTCNDNPALSSIHGHCTDAGVCVCADGGTSSVSGRCL
ncbi:MAG TPA: hypothetical protein VKQ32_30055 [Polyangia bacterium]|nr:hypothetical protein [Polyangia bacterium]